MKIIHTADWHLGDNFHGYDRLAEHDHFLHWLRELIARENPDALLMCGDIFDNANPSAQAEELLFSFLADVTSAHRGIQIIMIAGNHDSGRRLEAPASLLRHYGVEVRGVVERDDNGAVLLDNLVVPLRALNNPEERVGVLAVPYLRFSDLEAGKPHSQAVREFFLGAVKQARHTYGKKMPLLLMAHLYAAGSEVALNEHSERLVVGGEDCIDVKGLDNDVAYVALGHIHKAQQVGGEDRMVFYAGSPIPMSFAEKNYSHGVNKLIVGSTGGVVLEREDYEPMRRLRSIPAKGAATLPEILKFIEQLPDKNKKDPDQWDYLEVRLQDSAADVGAQKEIIDALESKAVRLCRLIRTSLSTPSQEDDTKRASLEQLRNIKPLDIALDVYLAARGEEMTDEQVQRFNLALAEAQNHPDETTE